MKTNQDFSIDQAARQLGIGSKTLRAMLRKASVLADNNLPATRFIEAGYFRVDQRSYWIDHTSGRFQKYYAITLATGNGLAFIQEVIDAMGTRNGGEGQGPSIEILHRIGCRLQGEQNLAQRNTEIQRVGATVENDRRQAPAARHCA